MTNVSINGSPAKLAGDDDMPLLWFLRDVEGLTGTKFGCGAGLCGACTVHVNGQALRSCQTQIADLEDGDTITTIEGLAKGDTLTALQQAWAENDVPQCGYCQAGQIMQAAELLANNPKPSDEEIEEAMWGNICRCGTYQRIKAAIRQASGQASGQASA